MISITFGLPIPVERQPFGSLAVNVALLKLEVPGSIPGDGTFTFKLHYYISKLSI